jgi:hypothetical protein
MPEHAANLPIRVTNRSKNTRCGMERMTGGMAIQVAVNPTLAKV